MTDCTHLLLQWLKIKTTERDAFFAQERRSVNQWWRQSECRNSFTCPLYYSSTLESRSMEPTIRPTTCLSIYYSSPPAMRISARMCPNVFTELTSFLISIFHKTQGKCSDAFDEVRLFLQYLSLYCKFTAEWDSERKNSENLSVFYRWSHQSIYIFPVYLLTCIFVFIVNFTVYCSVLLYCFFTLCKNG